MSHWTKMRLKVTDRDLIKAALSRMGYTFQEGNFTISAYGQSEKSELKLDNSLGLSQQQDGTWAFVGDPYHCKTQNLHKFYGKLDQLTKQLSTCYAVEESKQLLEEQQFFCTDNEDAIVGQDGMITMVYERLG